MELSEMRNMDPRDVDRKALCKRSDVKIRSRLGKEERIRDYIRQIGNPYCYLDEKTVVKISFADAKRTIEDCIKSYLNGV